MKTSEILSAVRIQNRKHLLEPEAKEICSDYNIPVTKFKVGKNAKEVADIGEEIGYPVVLKIVSPDILHKSDIGGVQLDLNNTDEVVNAYHEILGNVKKRKPNARISGILVQEMAPQSTEIIIGAVKDSQFGQTIMFGLGGVFVEILKDVVFSIAPIDKQEAESMITKIKAYPILKGYRGNPPLDTNAIVQVLVNTSKLVTNHQEIKELDLNPVMVYKKGVKTVDARIILE